VALYAVVGCGNNDGEVTTNSHHKNCNTIPIGYTYPYPKPSTLNERRGPLFVGQTPGVNAGIVSNNQAHLNGVNIPIGYTIGEGPAAQQHLYLGRVQNVNAGQITTKLIPGLLQNADYGFTLKDNFKLPGSVALYVVTGCGGTDGEVTTNPVHKNCSTVPIGYTYPP
jgi:hypothetical protein